MNIDWSKAPEGATHKEVSQGREGYWYKFDFESDTAAYWTDRQARWVNGGKASEYNDGSMDFMVARLAEQVGAEERDAGIKDLINKIADGANGLTIAQARTAAIAIWDAGYRKCP